MFGTVGFIPVGYSEGSTVLLGIDECELTDTLSVDAQALDKYSVLVTQKGCLRLICL